MRNRLCVLGLSLLTLGGCEPTPKVLALLPTPICNGIDTKVMVSGENFCQTPTVTLTGPAGQAYKVGAPDVTWLSDKNLTFMSHASLGIAPGTYDLTVTNPKGHAGTLRTALTVIPPPGLLSIAPAAVCDMVPTALTLTGMLFHD